MSSAPANSGDVPSHSPGFATGATAASASVDVFSSASAVRIEELQRTLEALYRDILFPFYEPVERLRVVTNRAIRIQDVVDAVEKQSQGAL
ncbi:hypothetical protein LDHU3_27.3280:CDS1 [Leishmania donovani]|uniref:Hypothetical_protein n=2 Tax=Leishmania donovani species complex TaxID=38574 RepID=A0A6L0XT22_LEIIN|nr:hypothetical protein LdCL_270028900 [Leishmania donovani]CAC9500651.1 hypothetical_protein [Leishmania infantum]CAJ1990105.1 hypothetical protein LDHU3_27.3280:CDS1 [Leishmania donovani]SUZ43124.1 hypothetical_protein [Leishmania infantum]VDZ45962.1 hypothetical_protein [Leishmania donovani]